MMRRTSNRVMEQVDKMLLPVVVRMCDTSWECLRNYTNTLIMSELGVMVSTCLLTTVVLDFTGHNKLTVADAAKFGGVLTQCPPLEHLEIMAIKFDRNAAAFDVVARGLTQCTSLTFLRFRDIMMTSGVSECLAGVLGHCPTLAHLDLNCTVVGTLVPRDVANKEVL